MGSRENRQDHSGRPSLSASLRERMSICQKEIIVTDYGRKQSARQFNDGALGNRRPRAGGLRPLLERPLLFLPNFSS
jgi:hypothetical protein